MAVPMQQSVSESLGVNLGISGCLDVVGHMHATCRLHAIQTHVEPGYEGFLAKLAKEGSFATSMSVEEGMAVRPTQHDAEFQVPSKNNGSNSKSKAPATGNHRTWKKCARQKKGDEVEAGLASPLGKGSIAGLGVLEQSGSRRKRGKNVVSAATLDGAGLVEVGSQPRQQQ